MNNRLCTPVIWITIVNCLLAERVNRLSFLDDLSTHPEWSKTHRAFTDDSSGFIQKVTAHQRSRSLFVATDDSIIRLSVDKLEKLDQVKWAVSQDKAKKCISKEDCDSRGRKVTLMVPKDGSSGYSDLSRADVYVCWTDGASSECSLRMGANLRGPPKELWKGTNMCPQDKDHFSVAISTSDRALYFSSVSTRNAEIVKVMSRRNAPSAVRTAPRLEWISQDGRTVFIHAYEFHNAVYYIFREFSEEIEKQCGEQVILSRVARICLNDDGGRDNLLSSFSKATLICTNEQSDSSLHMHVQSVTIDTASKTMFAAFTTSASMPDSSAICIYKLTEIEDAFRGPFMKPDGGKTNFERSGKCESSDIRSWFDHHLMHNVIRPNSKSPMIEVKGERWSKIAVDWMPFTPKSDYNLIVFTIDAKNQLRKWYHAKSATCLIEEIQKNQYLGPMSRGQITNIVLLNGDAVEDKALILSTKEAVFRIPVARCGRLGHTKEGCTLLHDPYCFWNNTSFHCEFLQETIPSDERFSTCLLNGEKLTEHFLLDGGWGAWSPWSSCQTTEELRGNVEEYHTLDMQSRPRGCQCRYRFCSSPFPLGAGADKCTKGNNIEMTNCSIDGGWSDWSAWSGCDPACRRFDTLMGIQQPPSVRTRRRWCTNPPPTGPDGLECEGHSKEEEPCPKPTVMCPADRLPEPQWSQWSVWSACSLPCNGGYQLRQRECGRHEREWRPQPPSDVLAKQPVVESYSNDLLCIGESVEQRECNQNACPLTRVFSSWTEWFLVSGDPSTGTHERRYRVECEANVPEADKLQVEQQKQAGACKLNADGDLVCHELANDPSDKSTWSEVPGKGDWSGWTECSHLCAGGLRYRQREGKSDSRKEEICNTQACPGRWGCWSSWSECSAPPCSVQLGEQRRRRSCLVSDETGKIQPTDPDQCEDGPDLGMESRPCRSAIPTDHCVKNGRNYERLGPWQPNNTYDVSTWAGWSECFPVNEEGLPIKLRARVECEECDEVEAQRCDTHEPIPIARVLDEATIQATSKQRDKKYTMAHAVIVALLSALLGMVLVLIPYLIYMMRKRLRKEKEKKYKRSSLWKKLVDGNTKPDQNSPYILSAQTKNPIRTPSEDLVSQTWMKIPNPTATLRTQDTWLNQGTTSLRRNNLTRIQMLHQGERQNGNVAGSDIASTGVYGTQSHWSRNDSQLDRTVGSFRSC